MSDQMSEPVGEVRVTGQAASGRWLSTVILTADLPDGTKVYAAPQAPSLPSTWPKIEHPNRPAEADSESADLQRMVARVGFAALAAALRIYALSQPSRGSFAGSLWAMYECLAAAHAAAPAPAVPDGWKLLPTELTAENGAKGALIGEFSVPYRINCVACEGTGEVDEGIECEGCGGEGWGVGEAPIDWPTIKDIWRKAVQHFAAMQEPKS